MRRLRWAADGGLWELDREAPVTMEGTARAVPGDPLPLGLSRGPRISRPKQLDFMHRFMSSPLVPSFAGDPSNGGHGLLLHHAHTVHLFENWSATVLGQFHIQKFVSIIKERASNHLEKTSWPKTIAKHMLDILSLGFGTEFLVTPDSSFLLEAYDVKKANRGKAIFHHKLPKHNLTLEAAWPGLFVDENGTYWDVPLSMAIDLASITAASGLSYHICLQHNRGQPEHFGGDKMHDKPMSLLPGFSAKAAISIKKNVDLWRTKEGKLKMVQPYDVFLSDPHISASGIIGAVTSASLGDCSKRFFVKDESHRRKTISFCSQKNKFALFSDLFASVSFTAQHGNFQRPFLDLTRLNARLDFPSGSTFLKGAAHLAQDFYHSRQPDSAAMCAICPDMTVALQQQIVGPLSFRAESRIEFDPRDKSQFVCIGESIFAIDWALKVLGSARATAWYSPKRHEAMVELRFFES
ncbi:protein TRIGALACTOSYLDIACYLGLYCEROL 4, chloroplastic [Cocos nucifera]|uniref:Protein TRIGALACTOSYLDIACYLGLYCEROL 4, chloroplastic n=1 Tax=Cocos nucifera TaxID=13894 RepID=A0A8K0HWP0_COCNU|nr:protein TRIGALACTOSYLDIACYLGLYCEROL 4, chloroplastic [Cocos nucifera]